MAAITMQGNWTLQVDACDSAYAQRLVIEGADAGNGVHDGIAGRRVHVQGSHWTLRVQHRPAREAWRDSTLRLGLPNVEAGLLRVEIGSNDGGLDEAFDDLVIACTLPISRREHVVYGEVTAHDGASPFNPRRDDYLVIDAPVDLPALCDRHPALEPVISRLYPQRRLLPAGMPADPTPLVLPNGLPGTSVGLRFDSRVDEADACGADEAAAVRLLQASVGRVPFQTHAMEAGASILTRSELGALVQLRDQLVRQPCEAEAVPQLTLAFQRYHRSTSEAAGGAYRGTGLREPLGHAVSDSQGRYLFRFRQRSDAAPDLLVQVVALGRGPVFETAPYDRVAHLRRIDLCVPKAVCSSPARPGPEKEAPEAASLERRAAEAASQQKRAAEAALCRRRCS